MSHRLLSAEVNMEKNEMPVGLAMALAMNPDAMQKFALLSEEKKQEIISDTHNVSSKAEMRQYWESERGAEVDFVIQREGKIIPIEVKSADNTRAKSLAEYIKSFKPDYAIKVSAKNFGFEDGKKTVPLYAVFCI